jgi:hypothetical protein
MPEALSLRSWAQQVLRLDMKITNGNLGNAQANDIARDRASTAYLDQGDAVFVMRS